MSRDKVTAKDAIEALLVILRHHASNDATSFTSASAPTPVLTVSAELLRRGKHDVDDASLPLWEFLHDFLTVFFESTPSTSISVGRHRYRASGLIAILPTKYMSFTYAPLCTCMHVEGSPSPLNPLNIQK